MINAINFRIETQVKMAEWSKVPDSSSGRGRGFSNPTSDKNKLIYQKIKNFRIESLNVYLT